MDGKEYLQIENQNSLKNQKLEMQPIKNIFYYCISENRKKI